MAPIPKPLPLPSSPRALIPAPPPAPDPDFPLKALGPGLEAAVLAAAHRTQAPVELVAHHLLTLAAMPAQRLVPIRLPTGAVHPVSYYFLTIVGAGEGRASAERLCVAPVRFWEKRFSAAGTAGAAVAAGGNVVAIDIQREPSLEMTVRDVEPPPRVARPAPARPFAVERVFLSPFRSGIADRYARFGHRGGLFASVAADLLTPSCARRSEAVSLRALWDGALGDSHAEPHPETGAEPGAEGTSPAPRLSAHLVAAPGEGIALLRAAELANTGLLGRMLAAWPASRIGARAIEENDGRPPPDLRALHVRLTALCAREAPTETRVLSLESAAAADWLAFARECESAMREGGAFETIRPLAGHLAEHAARLAAVLALVEDGAVAELGAAHLARGMTLARYYAAEALRLAGVAVTANTAVTALHAWLAREYAGREVSLRDIYRGGPAAVRSLSAAQRSMRHIERLGLAERQKGACHGNAGLRWRIPAVEESVA